MSVNNTWLKKHKKWSSMSHAQQRRLGGVFFDPCQRSPHPLLVAMDGMSHISSQLMSMS